MSNMLCIVKKNFHSQMIVIVGLWINKAAPMRWRGSFRYAPITLFLLIRKSSGWHKVYMAVFWVASSFYEWGINPMMSKVWLNLNWTLRHDFIKKKKKSVAFEKFFLSDELHFNSSSAAFYKNVIWKLKQLIRFQC